MARPLRIEFSGALYHVTSQDNRREPIFEDDEDRVEYLKILEGIRRITAITHVYQGR
jgi:putative transposase